MSSFAKRESIASGLEPTFNVCWKDDDVLPAESGHEIELGTIADVLSILSAALDGNAWDLSITQNDAESGECAA